jgi:septin family protein
MNKWFIEHPIKFEHPFTAMVIGPSMSGKTQFIKKVLYYHEVLFFAFQGTYAGGE